MDKLYKFDDIDEEIAFIRHLEESRSNSHIRTDGGELKDEFIDLFNRMDRLLAEGVPIEIVLFLQTMMILEIYEAEAFYEPEDYIVEIIIPGIYNEDSDEDSDDEDSDESEDLSRKRKTMKRAAARKEGKGKKFRGRKLRRTN
ncbi:uncharacterized protein LOC135841381 [Planococcus citri]